jgi:hypothetical protein
MAATSSTPGSPRRGGKTTIGSRLAIFFASLGGIGAIGLVFYLVVLTLGQVHGHEICAQTLERRSFSFYEIPLLGIQVRGTAYVDVSGDLEKHLASSKLVPNPPAAKKTWHVIYVSRGAQGVRRGDPEILVRYLDARDSDHNIAWLEWTKTNPQLAPAIWRGVSDLATAGKYALIPDILELAEKASDPVATQTEVSRLVNESTKSAPSSAPPKS